MNNEKQTQQAEPADPWAPVTVSAKAIAEHDQIQDSYQQMLTAAGYGTDQRDRYIEQSGLDPDHAACVWDEEIVPAAEAAGTIPGNPDPFGPAERQTLNTRNAALDEFWKQHPEYDVFSNAPEHQELFRQAMEYGDARARQVLGSQVADHLLSTPQVSAEDLDPEVDEHDIDL